MITPRYLSINNYRFSGSVFPSDDDDVNVSPYNCAFSLNKLIENADCVFPFDNTSLLNISKNIDQLSKEKDNKEQKLL